MMCKDLTVVTAIRNRNVFLEQTLPTWLYHPVRKVFIFDMRDESCERAYDVVARMGDPRVIVYETQHEYAYSTSLAINAMLPLLETENLLKLDCDVKIEENFFDLHPLHTDNLVYGRTSSDGLTGSFYCKTGLLKSIGGFNENITTYGWEDIDVYDKLQWWRGADIQPFDLSCVSHIAHSVQNRIYSLLKNVDGVNDEQANAILYAFIHLNDVIKANTHWDETSRMTQWKHTKICDNLYRTERDYVVF